MLVRWHTNGLFTETEKKKLHKAIFLLKMKLISVVSDTTEAKDNLSIDGCSIHRQKN